MTARIHHFDLYGPRQSKYDALRDSSVASIQWEPLAPNAPYYLFIPQEQAFRQEYEAGWKVTDVFPVNSVGMVTARDRLVLDVDAAVLTARMKRFGDTSVSDQEIEAYYGVKSTGTWSMPEARKIVASNKDHSEYMCSYRPFDTRYIYYHDAVVERRLYAVLGNLTKPNVALTTVRQTKAEEWHHALVTNAPVPAVFLEVKDVTSVFPLWLYPKEGTLETNAERRANIAPAFLTELQQRTGDTPAPEDIFHYAYAVFHAPAYRTRYAPFLKTDFPRLPLPPDADAFRALAALGAKLTALHLLEAPELDRHGIGFPVSGDHTVKKMRLADRYAPPTPGGQPGRVKLNDAEYFENVPPEAWEFQVGGYRPAAKWLDDRQGRSLTAADITHYRRMIAAMRATAHLLPQIDAAFQPLLTPFTPESVP